MFCEVLVLFYKYLYKYKRDITYTINYITKISLKSSKYTLHSI